MIKYRLRSTKAKKSPSVPSPCFAAEHQFPSPQVLFWKLLGKKGCHLFRWQQGVRTRVRLPKPYV